MDKIKNFMRSRIGSWIALIFLVLGLNTLCPLFISEGRSERPSHLDQFQVPEGCFACHRGHGRRSTPMLRKSVPELCFECHSPYRTISSTASIDVYYSLQKQYRHPVRETAHLHQHNESLPEQSAAQQRHVSCLDCHNHHLSEKGNPSKHVSGYTAYGFQKKEAETVNEICYKCHADSVNKPSASPDVKEQFSPNNASYHPVERVAKGQSVSLISRNSGSKMDCIDCHDPHGSDFDSMLLLGYERNDGVESLYAYQLCYGCHSRDRILSDQGFLYHKKHVVINSISCATCHTAHGSAQNPRLIQFNRNIVKPGKSGLLDFSKIGRTVNCFLNCHGIEHIGDNIVR